MDCRRTEAHKFKTRLGFKNYGIILTKEQSVLTKMKKSFERESMQIKYNVLGYRIDSYFYQGRREIPSNQAFEGVKLLQ